MSTSIYSGYKLNGNYDFVSLNNFLMKLRKEVTKICEQKIFDRVVRQTLYYYNFNQLHGSDAVQSMIERTSQSKKTKDRCEIWKSTLHNDWYDVYLKNYSKILMRQKRIIFQTIIIRTKLIGQRIFQNPNGNIVVPIGTKRLVRITFQVIMDGL